MARPEPLNPLNPLTLPKLAPLGALTHKRKEEVEPDRKQSDCDATWVTSFNLDVNKVFALAFAVDERISIVDQLINTQSKALRDLQVWANQALSGLTEDGPALEGQVTRLQQIIDTIEQRVQELGSKQTDVEQKVGDLHSRKEQDVDLLAKVEELWHAYQKKGGPFEQSTTASIPRDSVNPRGGMPVWAWILFIFVGMFQIVTLLIALKH